MTSEEARKRPAQASFHGFPSERKFIEI